MSGLVCYFQVVAYQKQPKDAPNQERGRNDSPRLDWQKNASHERRRTHQGRPPGHTAGVKHEGHGRERPVQPGDDDRRRHGGVQALLLRGDGDDVGAADMDNDPTQHAPGVAGPCKGGSDWPVREEQAGVRRPEPPQNRK